MLRRIITLRSCFHSDACLRADDVPGNLPDLRCPLGREGGVAPPGWHFHLLWPSRGGEELHNAWS